MTPEEFAGLVNVSRETLERLEAYIEMLVRWQRAINLVGSATLSDPWRRHILDCAQLVSHIPAGVGATYDLGSGAGLPGLILAIMGQQQVHLVESDQRKSQFLREVARHLELSVDIQTRRIETLPKENAGLVTARALAPLPRLLDIASPLLGDDTVCLFLKGRSASDELTQIGKCWRMASQSIPSLSDPTASILKLWDIRRAPLHRE